VGDSCDKESPEDDPVNLSEQPEMRLAIDYQATVGESDENISEDQGKHKCVEVETGYSALEDHECLAVNKPLFLLLLEEK
jgi:hypothetical protein